MAEKRKIRFIRKNGRIIPIRVKDKQSVDRKKIALGAAAVAGGVATTLIAGAAAGRIARSALTTGRKALFKQKVSPLIADPRLKAIVANKQLKQQRSMKFKANIFPQLFNSVALGIGGATIGEGVTKIGEGVAKRDAKLGEEIVASASGLGISALALGVFKRGLRR